MTEPICDVCGQVHRVRPGVYFKSHEAWEQARAKRSASLKRTWAKNSAAIRAKRKATYNLKKKNPEAGDPWMQEAIKASGITRCAHCDWTFEGSMADGIVAARVHRRETHRHLPVASPNRDRRKPRPKPEPAASEKPKNEQRERLVTMLKEAGKPVTAVELAAQVEGMTKTSIGVALSWAKRQGEPVRQVGDAWVYGAEAEAA